MEAFNKKLHRTFVFLLCMGIPLMMYTTAPAAMGHNYKSGGGNTFIFNPGTHSYVAIDHKGRVVKTGRASGGRNYCPDIHRACRTPTGTFKVRSQRGADCRSSRYPVGRGGSPMPYCTFFTQYYAIHGSYEVPNYNASHGCIRINPAEAKWLQKNFFRVGTTVVVKPY